MSFEDYFAAANVKAYSAIDYYSRYLENNKIITMCQKFDNMLGGGFSCGKLTELYGLAGIGKTQLCFQLCITVQIPKCLGGMNGEAIYIDTEGSFSTNRMLLVAKYTLDHCRKIANLMKLSKEELDHVKKLNENDFLNSIFYFRCTEQLQLLALSYRLYKFCKIHPKVRLILVDSIAFHFRYDSENITRRNRILSVISQNMKNIATQFGVAVIFTNQMTTKFVKGVGFATPALGESWGHNCHIRIQLQHASTSSNHRSSICRQAVLLKHVSQSLSSAFYQITIGGIRDFVIK